MADVSETDISNLMELQDKMIQIHEGARRVANQERARTRQKHVQELTVQELKALPDDVACYRSVGKAYFLTTKAATVQEHDDMIAAAAKELALLKENKVAVEQKLKETEDELRELVKSNPQLIHSLANFRPT